MDYSFPDPAFVDTNGIRMAVYEMGRGPAVIFLHGFPELAFSWRYQLPAVSAAGYRAIAPDQRGYGRTDCPDGIESYAAEQLIGDILGLLDALGLERAIFIGHDWGALLLWRMALLCPQRIERQVILNVPYYARPSRDPLTIMRERLGDHFYIVDFQDSQDADSEFAADPAHFFDVMMRRGQITRAQFEALPAEKKVLSLRAAMARKQSSGEALLSNAERDYFANAFATSGFTGPINWYRNWTHNWRGLEGVEERIDVPTLFIGAADDIIVAPEHVEAMKPFVTQLEIHMIDNCGHWTQQEHPLTVNRLIVDWLGWHRGP